MHYPCFNKSNITISCNNNTISISLVTVHSHTCSNTFHPICRQNWLSRADRAIKRTQLREKKSTNTKHTCTCIKGKDTTYIHILYTYTQITLTTFQQSKEFFLQLPNVHLNKKRQLDGQRHQWSTRNYQHNNALLQTAQWKHWTAETDLALQQSGFIRPTLLTFRSDDYLD